MFELFKEINWTLIGTLILVGALVSWAGDFIGMNLGKKRIKLFNLRPRHTSRIITVITGVGIAIISLFAISTASETVRTALFSMNYVQNQVTNLTAELQSNRSTLEKMELELFTNKGDLQEKQKELQEISKNLSEKTKALVETNTKIVNMESQMLKAKAQQSTLIIENEKLAEESRQLEDSVQSLKKESEELKGSMQRLREGRIATITGEILAQSVVTLKSGTSTEINLFFDRMLDEAASLLAYRFGTQKEEILPPILNEGTKNAVIKKLENTKDRWVIRMTALTNAVEGEHVHTRVDAYKTRLIYQGNQVLVTKKIKPGITRQEMEEVIFGALREVNAKAVDDGLLREPLTGNVGSADSAQIMEILTKAVGSELERKLEIRAANNIYTEGPVKVTVALH